MLCKQSYHELPVMSADIPKHQQQGWRYILTVERLTTTSQQHQQGHPGSSTAAAAEDLAIDQAWLDGTARSKPKPQTAADSLLPDDTLDPAATAGDYDDYCYSQGVLAATQAAASQHQQGFDIYTEGMSSSQAAAGGSNEAAGGGGGSGTGGRSGSKTAGSLQFAEHRSVRCSLVDQVWPQLVNTFRQVERDTSVL